MAAIKLLNLLAISSLAILATSFGPAPVNALSDGHDIGARYVHARGHDSVAKRKRTSTKKCRQRPTSSTTAKPTATSTSKAKAPTSTSSSSGGSGSSGGGNSNAGPADFGKKGVAWANGGTDGLSQYRVQGKKQLLYTWSPDIPSGLDKLGFIGVPMLWGTSFIDEFEKKVQKGYANYVLGFNEVNEPKQANIDPKTAAALWKQHMNPRKAMGYTIGSPSSSGNPNGIQWMQEFFDACDGGCIVDFMTVHWYDVTFEGFQKWVTEWHTKFGNRPVWVTEFACQNFNGGAQCSKDQIFSFVSQATKWAEETDWIQAIFPFGIMKDMVNVNPENAMMSQAGKVTDLGYTFLNS